jgi:acetyl/propionyl-CoA carboxylase alpha subunit
VVGVATNQPFHLRLLADPSFRAGEVDIQFLERRPDLVTAAPDPALIERLAIAAALAEDDRRRSQKPTVSQGNGGTETRGWLDQARRDGLR